MIGWAKQLKAAFGASFIWLVILIYFTQGFRSFVWTAVSYQLKDVLKLSPSASQFVFSIAFFPWSIKPLYGIFSDCIPIMGKRRIPYLFIATILSLIPWPVLGINESLRTLQLPLIVLLTAQNIGSAMADVVIDAMVAEAVKFERRAAFAGDLQTLSWFSMAFGGVCGSLLGGYALSNLKTDLIFLLFAILPAIQLLSCCFVDDNPGSTKVPEEASEPASSIVNDIDGKTEKIPADISKGGAYRRKRNQKNDEKRPVVSSKIQESGKGGSLVSQWLQSLKMATYSLFHAFRQPMILRPMAWFFLAQVTFPNLSTVMFYYQTEFLKLEASFLGTVRVVGWLGLMLGTFIYNHYLKKIKLRRILMWTHIGLCIMTLLDIVLVSRLNVEYGISDKFMVLWGSALADAINQFKFMPFLILSGQLCPPGIEGTLFALFMSINNFGSTMGSFVGAGLASILNISSGSFDNLAFGIAIQFVCICIPVAFLFLIPKEATGVST